MLAGESLGSEGGEDRASGAAARDPGEERGTQEPGGLRELPGLAGTYQLFALQGLVSAHVLETNVSGPQSHEGGSLCHSEGEVCGEKGLDTKRQN